MSCADLLAKGLTSLRTATSTPLEPMEVLPLVCRRVPRFAHHPVSHLPSILLGSPSWPAPRRCHSPGSERGAARSKGQGMSLTAGIRAHLKWAGGKGCCCLAWRARGQALDAVTLGRGQSCRGSHQPYIAACPAHACHGLAPHHGYVGLLSSPLLPCILFSLGYLGSRN